MEILELEETIVADGVIEVLPQRIDGMTNVATESH